MCTERRWLRAASLLAAGLAVPFACTRRADLPEPPEAVTVPTASAPEAGDVVTLETSLGGDAHAACAQRPEGDCRGPIDFTCQLEPWVRDVADECQRATGCETNGWLEVTMGDDGCVVEIGMDQPDEDFAACVADAMGAARCPCGAATTRYWLGEGHAGSCPDSGPLT